MNATLIRTALGTLAVSACLAVPGAQATDIKVSNGSVCQPYSTTTLPSDLAFRANGLKNISANAEYIVCNVLVDIDSAPAWYDRTTVKELGAVRLLFHGATLGAT